MCRLNPGNMEANIYDSSRNKNGLCYPMPIPHDMNEHYKKSQLHLLSPRVPFSVDLSIEQFIFTVNNKTYYTDKGAMIIN